MKFRTIFWIFNIVLIFCLFIIGGMPILMMGWDLTLQFWSDFWYLFALFFIGLAVVNVFFVRNLKLFSLVEEEDWIGLLAYYELKMEKGSMGLRDAQTYLNTAILQNKSEKVGEMESWLDKNKPSLKARLALYFGLPFFIKTQLEDSIVYFSKARKTQGALYQGWMDWLYGFSLAVGKDGDRSREVLWEVTEHSSRSPVLLLATAYILDGLEPVMDEKEKAKLSILKKELRTKSSESKWKKNFEKAGSDNILIVLISKILYEALDWLFDKPKTEVSQGGENAVH